MRTKRTIGLALSAVVLLTAGSARAEFGSPNEAQGALRRLAQTRGFKFHDKALDGGRKRIAVNVSMPDHLDAVSNLMGRGKNVLQILHIAKAGHSHTLAMFDGEMVHLQTPDSFRSWRLNTWGYGLRPSSSKLYSAFIHLTPAEGKNLRTRIATARQQQGISGTMTDAFGNRSMNCASGWCSIPIGAKGEPLWKLIGLSGPTGMPQGLQRSLEHGGNDRVFGVAVYGPQMPDFDRKANTTLFNFDE